MTQYCPHHALGECGSCPWLLVPYSAQLAARYDDAVQTLAAVIGAEAWLPPVESPVIGIRNKAKMAVTGTVAEPKLGLTTGVDLCDCQIYLPVIRDALPVLKQFITMSRLQPYDLSPSSEKITPAKARSRGELKYVIVTASPANELMVTLVMRSTADLARIKSKLPLLQEMLPNLKVFSLNIQPEHKATLLGDREIVLTSQTSLPIKLGNLELYLGPMSFFQTNTGIAAKLYETAANWVAELDWVGAVPSVGVTRLGVASKPTSNLRLWDLYCGVGGFALSLAAPGREITGIELSPDAIANAKQAAGGSAPFLDSATSAQNDGSLNFANTVTFNFIAEDATNFALSNREPAPDLVIVNPPRRGIGPELTNWINETKIPYVLYSSCNPNTLAQDLPKLTNYQVIKAQLFDMFPNTNHSEVLALLQLYSG